MTEQERERLKSKLQNTANIPTRKESDFDFELIRAKYKVKEQESLETVFFTTDRIAKEVAKLYLLCTGLAIAVMVLIFV